MPLSITLSSDEHKPEPHPRFLVEQTLLETAFEILSSLLQQARKHVFISVVELRRDCSNQEAAQETVPTIVVALVIAFGFGVQTISRSNSAAVETHVPETSLARSTAATVPLEVPISGVIPSVARIISNLLEHGWFDTPN